MADIKVIQTNETSTIYPNATIWWSSHGFYVKNNNTDATLAYYNDKNIIGYEILRKYLTPTNK